MKATACPFWETVEHNSAKAAFCLEKEDMPKEAALGKDSPCAEQDGDAGLQAADTG